MCERQQLKALDLPQAFEESGVWVLPFMTSRWSGHSRAWFQVISLHLGDAVELISKFFNRKSISRNFMDRW